MGEDMDTHTRSILTAQQLNRELQFVSSGIIEINTKCYREEGGAHSQGGAFSFPVELEQAQT